MITFTAVIIAFVALQHILFLILEMFMWEKPLGRKIFALQTDFARSTKALAANQGLYNGFLAAGLIWGLWLGAAGKSLHIFFLLCIVIAGIFAALTVSKRIFFIQALPAAAALVLLWLS